MVNLERVHLYLHKYSVYVNQAAISQVNSLKDDIIKSFDAEPKHQETIDNSNESKF